MKIAVGSDERTHLTDTVVEELSKRGHDLVLFGPLAENDPDTFELLFTSRSECIQAFGLRGPWK